MKNLTEGEGTTKEAIELIWEPLTPVTESGKSFPILSYNLELFDTELEAFVEVVGETTAYTQLSYTKTDIVKGKEYNFRIRARNENGFGPYSEITAHTAD